MNPSDISHDDAATPLDPDEADGLRLPYIATRAELNAAEQANIIKAYEWVTARRREVLDERFLRELHRRMFGDVWTWAGTYRRSDKTVGIDWSRIAEELALLIADTAYWIEHGVFSPDEIAARFHHRLTWIHCFPNGNGRHARLATDLLLRQLGRPAFSWGSTNLASADDARRRYVDALRAADRHDFGPLLGVARL